MLTERGILVVLVVVMVILSFLQVFLRNVFSFGFLWADPLLRYVVLWVGFLGAMLATREEKHFGIDLLDRFVSGKLFHLIKFVIDAIGSVVSFLLARAALQFLFDAIGEEEKDVFDLSRRVYFAIIPIGFGVIALHFFLNMIQHGYKIFTKTTDADKASPMDIQIRRLP